MNFFKRNSGSVMGWVLVIILLIIIIGGISYYLSTQNGAIPPGALNGGSSTTGTTTQTLSATVGVATTSASTTTSAPMIPYYTLAVRTSPTLGQYLTAADGMTLYVYAHDSVNKSTCTGNCSIIWPPYSVISTGALTLAPHITGKIGFITRADGTKQVTYNGRPLYFYNKDRVPGDTKGNGVFGVWNVATP